MREYLSADPSNIPLVAPVDYPMVFEGFASTNDLDLDRVKMRPYAFGYPLLFRHGYPPLYLKHEPTTRWNHRRTRLRPAGESSDRGDGDPSFGETHGCVQYLRHHSRL